MSDVPLKHTPSTAAPSPTATVRVPLPTTGAPNGPLEPEYRHQLTNDPGAGQAAMSTPTVVYAVPDESGGPGRLVAGFILVMLGGLVAVLPQATWAELWSWAPKDQPIAWLQWVVAGVFVVIGASCLRCNPVWFLATSGLVGVTALCVNEFCKLEFANGPLVLASLGIGYLIHTTRTLTPPNARGAIGLALIAIAGLSLVRDWYDWASWSKRVGPNFEDFFEAWGGVFSWCTVLVLVALGVLSSRTRPIHFLCATLAAALAWYCYQTSMVRMVEFPQFNKTIEHVAAENIAAWQWAVIAELVIIAIVLFYKAVGMGALTLGCALLWMVLGVGVLDKVGSVTFAEEIGRGIQSYMRSPAMTTTQAALPTTLGSGASWLPVPSAESSDHADRAAPAVRVGMSAQRQTEIARREIIPLVWMYLIAILAGLIAAVGVSLLSEGAACRPWVCFLLWFCLGLAAASLWSIWPRDPDQDWRTWLAAFRLSRYHEYPIWLAFLASTTLFASMASRPRAHVESWIHAAIAAVMLGTASSLFGAMALDRWAGLSPLPVWVLIVVVVGQSSLMWALLLELHGPLKSKTVPEMAV